MKRADIIIGNNKKSIGISVVVMNRERIEEMIAKAQKGSRVRLVDFDTILDSIHYLEERLKYVNKTARDGCSFTIEPWAERFPSCYRGNPYATGYTLLYKKGEWRITDVFRANCNHAYKYSGVLTDAARNALAHSLDHM